MKNSKPKKFNSNILSRVLRFTKPYLHYLIITLICAAVYVALSLLVPVLIGRAVDFIVGKGNVDFAGALRVLIYIALSVAGAALAQWLMQLSANRITYNTVRDIRSAAFDRLCELPLSYYDSTSHGDVISRVVTDADLISDGLVMGFTQLFTGVITILGTLAVMLSVNYKIALLVVIITPLSLISANFIARRSYKMFREQSELRGQLTGTIEELVGEQKTVKTFAYEKAAQEKVAATNEKLRRAGVRALFFSALTNPTTRFVNSVVYTSVALTGALSAIGGSLTVGGLSCLLSYANQYTKPFNEISGVIAELQNALASASRVFELIDTPPQTPDRPDAIVLDHADGSCEMSHVSFSYLPERPLIEDFNLSVKPGQKIAIVGPTGCGKTTLINLLMRFYDVNDGSVSISGHDIRDLTRDSLRASYGMVLQETWLRSGTVRENIAYAKPDATEEEIVAAARAAHAHSFIKRLPDGYNTMIGESGMLSQGQRQLLCIARVMLALPDMLILDEATSSIDTRTELKISDAFNRMTEGRTSFIVAHRLSTIRNADRILVMNSGHIIECGTHSELLEANGFYAKLYMSQFRK